MGSIVGISIHSRLRLSIVSTFTSVVVFTFGCVIAVSIMGYVNCRPGMNKVERLSIKILRDALLFDIFLL